MKKLSLSIILITMFTFMSNSQNFDLHVDKDTVYFDLDLGTNQTFESKGEVTSNSDGDGNYTWEKTEVYLPDRWEIEICDKNNCWFPSVYSRSFDLAKNDTSILDVHVRTKGNPGDSAVVLVKVWNTADASLLRSDLYVFLDNKYSSVESIKPGEVVTRIYPNPVTDIFTVLSTIKLKNIEVYSILGNKMRVFPYQEGGSYNIGDLSRGMYLVRLVGEDNQTVRTLRLDKR